MARAAFTRCNCCTTHDGDEMAACLESLCPVNRSSNMTNPAALILAAGERHKDGEFRSKIECLPFRHVYAIIIGHWAYLFAAIDSPCAQLARLRTACPALLLLGSWNFSDQSTPNDAVKIPDGDPNEREEGTCWVWRVLALPLPLRCLALGLLS